MGGYIIQKKQRKMGFIDRMTGIHDSAGQIKEDVNK